MQLGMEYCTKYKLYYYFVYLIARAFYGVSNISSRLILQYLFPVAIAVMLLLIVSFLIAFNTSQRKKFQYHQNLLKLKEEQQKELVRMAVISEETERHRISETIA